MSPAHVYTVNLLKVLILVVDGSLTHDTCTWTDEAAPQTSTPRKPYKTPLGPFSMTSCYDVAFCMFELRTAWERRT